MSRTAEEWGRIAVGLPGWRALRGIRWRGENGVPMGSEWQPWPDPDDPATEGCLLRLLGHGVYAIRLAGLEPDGTSLWQWHDPAPDDAGEHWSAERLTLGRACIAAAAAIERWPGGEG